jgi:predicted regulator of Ras-like GTPase activity (Roadblock/LC7/MglB family)
MLLHNSGDEDKCVDAGVHLYRITEMDEECVAAFSSTVQLAANRTAAQLDNQHPDEVIIEAEQGNLLLIHLDGALLAVMTHAGLELNTGLLEIRSVARRLREILTIRTP